ncbi:OmpA family protein [Conexibacter woesei]|uniref:OmpA/MotB domain protein n=1 Tax=Conexibacter woesei (strain DSM 14684 / CCUG 47730 / CIP 108061 / JCM 11494 / NBRC 100937 / ID131577) TaxID=469383 RepID=D3EZI5_CONWI|nr:OmpA family protein [Conexibacter woesei]ADB53823.1 OmpA/MotB domain protein [Conexibacter woesei DSM 14684]
MADERPPTPSRKLVDGVVEGATKTLVALLSAASTVGFVAFAGAALTWLRFWTARLPADQAISHVPRSELIATGATALFLFAVLGVLATAAVYAIDTNGSATAQMRRGLILVLTAETLVAIWFVDELDDAKHVAAAIAVALLGALGAAIATYPTDANGNVLPTNQWRRHRWRTKLVADRDVPGGGHALDPTPTGMLLAAAFAIVAAALCFTVARYLAAVFLAAALFAVLAYGIARATQRFWPYGLAVFFSVALFGVVLQAGRLFAVPEAIPVAIVRTADGPGEGLTGLFVADDADGVWFATVARECSDGASGDGVEDDSGRLFHVPDRAVREYATGATMSVGAAASAAVGLLHELTAMQPSPSVSPLAGAVRRPPSADPPPAQRDDAACEPPRIERSVPSRPLPGRRVMLTGRGFGARPDRVEVDGRAVRSVSYWTPTRIVFQLPGDLPDGGTVVVRRGTAASRGYPLNPRMTGTGAAAVPDERDAVMDGAVCDARAGSTVDLDSGALFAYDSVQLRPGAIELVEGLCERRLLEGAATLLVVGYTDATGPAAYNRVLSRRQAARVRDVLLGEAVTRPRTVVVRGLGEARPRTDGADNRIRIVVRPAPRGATEAGAR